MTSGPVVLQVLEGENAIAKNRKTMGATNPADAADGTIRKDFAESIEANSVHGSDAPAQVAKGRRIDEGRVARHLVQRGRERQMDLLRPRARAAVGVRCGFGGGRHAPGRGAHGGAPVERRRAPVALRNAERHDAVLLSYLCPCGVVLPGLSLQSNPRIGSRNLYTPPVYND